jgi:hypothetical protein
MSLRRDIGCKHCGYVNETAPLDSIYTEHHSSLRIIGSWDSWFDYKFLLFLSTYKQDLQN